MPGMKTHDLFGALTLKEEFPPLMQERIAQFPGSYHLGLQGPDLFFYSPMPWLCYPLNPGNGMHRFSTGPFLSALFEARNGLPAVQQGIADAYICGFMGHYTLDAVCHPYVYCRTKHLQHKGRENYDFGIHVFLETDMDTACVRHYTGLDELAYGIDTQLSASAIEKQVLTELLYTAIHAVYAHFADPDHPEEAAKVRKIGQIKKRHIRQSFDTIVIAARLLNDPAGRKKCLARRVEQRLFGYAVISGMITTPGIEKYPDPCNENRHLWSNPWDPTKARRNSTVYDLMDEAAEILRRRCRRYEAAVTKAPGQPTDPAWMELVADLGNVSYNSGYPL